MLGIGLLLFSLRVLKSGRAWKEWPRRTAFRTINGGLALMALLSLLPIGLLRTRAAVEYGTWYARSAEFMQTSLMQNLRRLRALGDSVFAVGALLIAYFVFGLINGRSYARPEEAEARRPEAALPAAGVPARAGD